MPHPQLGEVAQIGVPIKLSDTPGKPGHFAPWKGQHAQEILLELGYPQETIDQLRSQRVI